jgi:hypothetical protein
MENNLYTPNIIYSSLNDPLYNFSNTKQENFIKFSKFVNKTEFLLITEQNEIILNKILNTNDTSKLFTFNESNFVYDFDM